MPNGATKSSAERKAKFMATAGGLPSGSKKLASQANGGRYNNTSGEDETQDDADAHHARTPALFLADQLARVVRRSIG